MAGEGGSDGVVGKRGRVFGSARVEDAADDSELETFRHYLTVCALLFHLSLLCEQK